MKTYTPEISWHNRLPTLSLDISQSLDESGNVYRIATGGNDCRIYIWLVDLGLSGNSEYPDIKIRAGLKRHQKSIGAVRFSSNNMLASGDDDGYIYLWKHNTEQDSQNSIESNVFLNDDGFEDLELWQQHKVLRGHVDDICDLSWSKDGQFLLSGSVDNSAILWDTAKGTKVWCSDLIKGYVQGVAIDPHGQYMAALSSDRTLRLYNFTDKRVVYATRRMNIKGNFKAFFCDDTVQTFCRRFEFSPDGQFLIAPTSRLVQREKRKTSTGSGINQIKPAVNHAMDIEVININSNGSVSLEKQHHEPLASDVEVKSRHVTEEADEMNDKSDNQPQESDESGKSKKPINIFLVFRRSTLNKPIHYYPTGREVALCARFSPVLYKLRDGQTNFWDIPYRIVFAVATSRSVLIYDSQQPTPIGYISQIHLARLTDLAWSSDGRLLMISSYDGYSTLITFDQGEFGEVYTGPMIEPVVEPIVEEELQLATKKGQKRSKIPKESPQSVKQARKEPKSPRKASPVKKTVTLTTLWGNIKKA